MQMYIIFLFYINNYHFFLKYFLVYVKYMPFWANSTKKNAFERKKIKKSLKKLILQTSNFVK